MKPRKFEESLFDDDQEGDWYEHVLHVRKKPQGGVRQLRKMAAANYIERKGGLSAIEMWMLQGGLEVRRPDGSVWWILDKKVYPDRRDQFLKELLIES